MIQTLMEEKQQRILNIFIVRIIKSCNIFIHTYLKAYNESQSCHKYVPVHSSEFVLLRFPWRLSVVPISIHRKKVGK